LLRNNLRMSGGGKKQEVGRQVAPLARGTRKGKAVLVRHAQWRSHLAARLSGYLSLWVKE
jgi:hypothetical protein